MPRKRKQPRRESLSGGEPQCACSYCRRIEAGEGDRVWDKLRGMSLERLMQIMIEHGLEPGEEAELRQSAWELYVEGVPRLIQIAAGEKPHTIRDPEGRRIEVLPSYCDRIRALDMLVSHGLGTADPPREREILRGVRATIEKEVTADLGLTLEELRAQCAETWQTP